MNKDWEQHIEVERDIVVAKLKGEGYTIEEEGMFIIGCWTVLLRRDNERVELSCDPLEAEEVCTGALAPEDAQWFVELISVWDTKDREGTEHFYPEN